MFCNRENGYRPAALGSECVGAAGLRAAGFDRRRRPPPSPPSPFSPTSLPPPLSPASHTHTHTHTPASSSARSHQQRRSERDTAGGPPDACARAQPRRGERSIAMASRLAAKAAVEAASDGKARKFYHEVRAASAGGARQGGPRKVSVCLCAPPVLRSPPAAAASPAPRPRRRLPRRPHTHAHGPRVAGPLGRPACPLRRRSPARRRRSPLPPAAPRSAAACPSSTAPCGWRRWCPSPTCAPPSRRSSSSTRA